MESAMGAGQISPEVSNKLSNISFVCACLVVMIHYPHGEGLVLNAFYHVFPGAFSRMAVPCFFLISGFLLSCSDEGWWKRAVVKRVKSLLVPYFVLNSLFAVWKVFQIHCANHVAYGELLSVGKIVEMFGVFPNGIIAVGPLWYLRTLFLFVLLSPVLVWLVRKARGYAFVTVPPLLAAAIMIDTKAAQYFYCYRGLAYFMMGIWFRMYGIPRVNLVAAWISLLVGLAFLAIGKIPAVSDAGIAMAIAGIWGAMPPGKWPSFFKQSSFPIYVYHPIVIAFGWVALRHLGWFEVFSSSPAINLPVLFGVIMFCAGLGYIVRTNRVLCALLLGGR